MSARRIAPPHSRQDYIFENIFKTKTTSQLMADGRELGADADADVYV